MHEHNIVGTLDEWQPFIGKRIRLIPPGGIEPGKEAVWEGELNKIDENEVALIQCLTINYEIPIRHLGLPTGNPLQSEVRYGRFVADEFNDIRWQAGDEVK